MKLGVQLHPERGVDYVLTEARNADVQGFDSVWLGDHVMSGKGSWRGPDGPDGPLDGFTLMTAVGASTSRVRLAWSMLNVSFRYPAMLAKVLASLDQITRGRVICSLGSGSFPDEYVAYNIPVIQEHDARVEYTREVVELLIQLWTNPAPAKTTFVGKHVQVTGLPFNPAPYQKPRPPIWIGGESEATLQIVKDLADGWVTLTRSMDRGEKGTEHAGRGVVENAVTKAIGAEDWPSRPMTVVGQATVIVDEDHDRAVGEAMETLGIEADAVDAMLRREVVGTPDECVDRLRAIASTGVNYVRTFFANHDQQARAARLLLGEYPELSV